MGNNPAQPIRDFTTGRLSVRHWGESLQDSARKQALVQDILPILTPAVLQYLPPSLMVAQTTQAVSGWVDDRAADSDVLTVRVQPSGELNAPLTLIGGVAKGNGASAHILRKQGFCSNRTSQMMSWRFLPRR